MLLTHWARRAASRAACTAGRSRAINTAMIAMTTSNSISVNPRGRDRSRPSIATAPLESKKIARFGPDGRPGRLAASLQSDRVELVRLAPDRHDDRGAVLV